MKYDRSYCRISAEQTNGMADWESENHLDSIDWELDPLLFQSLT